MDIRIEQVDGTLVATCVEHAGGEIVCRTRVFGAAPEVRFPDRAALGAELARIPVMLVAVVDGQPLDLDAS